MNEEKLKNAICFVENNIGLPIYTCTNDFLGVLVGYLDMHFPDEIVLILDVSNSINLDHLKRKWRYISETDGIILTKDKSGWYYYRNSSTSFLQNGRHVIDIIK